MLGIMRGGRLLWISLVVQVKNLTGSAGEPGDVSLISGSGRSRREGNGNLFQYFAGKFHGWRSLAGYIQSEKWKWKLLSPVWLCDPMDCTFHGILQARILEWVAFSFSRGSSQPSDWTPVSLTTGGFFTSWAIREAKEYWSGSLSLLQWLFSTQESNWSLLHCRQILYQLSYRGNSTYNSWCHKSQRWLRN